MSDAANKLQAFAAYVAAEMSGCDVDVSCPDNRDAVHIKVSKDGVVLKEFDVSGLEILQNDTLALGQLIRTRLS